jgi:hypothetical protein
VRGPARRTRPRTGTERDPGPSRDLRVARDLYPDMRYSATSGSGSAKRSASSRPPRYGSTTRQRSAAAGLTDDYLGRHAGEAMPTPTYEPRPCPVSGGRPLHRVQRTRAVNYAHCLTHEETIDGKTNRLNRAPASENRWRGTLRPAAGSRSTSRSGRDPLRRCAPQPPLALPRRRRTLRSLACELREQPVRLALLREVGGPELVPSRSGRDRSSSRSCAERHAATQAPGDVLSARAFARRCILRSRS